MGIKEIINILTNKFGTGFTSQVFDSERNIEHLLTDSRNHYNPENTLFFAIKTKGGNDGHKFLNSLFEKGVRNFVVEYIPKNFTHVGEANLFIVRDSIDALTEIGKKNRQNAKEILAITGSRGKTTVKEMIFQLLEADHSLSRSPRSFNSKIGVPLSLWGISPNTELAIIEAGISQKGEMKRLADEISPDIVILTNIGEAHSQGFVSHQEKSDEKVILAYHPNVKSIIYHLDDDLIENSLKNLSSDKQRIRWSTSNRDAELFIEPTKEILKYKWRYPFTDDKSEIMGKIPIQLEKPYDLENIATSLAFMLEKGVTPVEIEKRFRNLHRINTRLNVSDGINGCSVILDSYTSDLSSLLPAIDFTMRRKMPSQSTTLILSDLQHEVGNVSQTYEDISKIVKEAGISRFIGIGPTFQNFVSLFPENSRFFLSTEEFLNEMSASDFTDEIILLKGAPNFNFQKIHQQLEAKKHETVLEVNLDAILRNFNYFRSKIPSSTGIIAMVKASGYGAGSYEIAKTLQDAGASYLAVAALDEGIDLRNNGISMPIMVMNPKSANYKALFKNQLEPVIYSQSMIQDLIEDAKKNGIDEYPVHIKLDTGMHRMGFEQKDLELLKSLLAKAHNIKVTSIFSHLATADCLDMDEYTHRQLERFEKMSSELIGSLGYSVKRHILNSAGILRFPEFHYELVRLGIGLYGANTLPPEIEKPLSVVSTLRTVIICIREIDGDEAVGYGRKGKIIGKRRIATIPIGYADGMNRHFGNGAINVLVNGQKAPTIGNICMDATMIDVTDINCHEGDSVEIFGEKMSVQTLADTLDTIPYEILTSVSPRVKRIYYRE
ncbi:MAG: bifunctional UDP-N-acetylmuramoyl-tripeptide:D-alanyl-D-alanine ligase/alanine racemase [Muribaculaceae bacterium]|nr:bifunctional UDP-N-acetylmuramoyl-tripeptide:D-alanyl-D-alanine ligase/alanine racemase [Muribaculaceae bacterium]